MEVPLSRNILIQNHFVLNTHAHPRLLGLNKKYEHIFTLQVLLKRKISDESKNSL